MGFFEIQSAYNRVLEILGAEKSVLVGFSHSADSGYPAGGR
jgi:hypothetical protein